MSASDELRELLRSAEYEGADQATPLRGTRSKASDSSREDLASLLSSLDASLRTPPPTSYGDADAASAAGGMFTGGLSSSNMERLGVLASANKTSPRATPSREPVYGAASAAVSASAQGAMQSAMTAALAAAAAVDVPPPAPAASISAASAPVASAARIPVPTRSVAPVTGSSSSSSSYRNTSSSAAARFAGGASAGAFTSARTKSSNSINSNNSNTNSSVNAASDGDSAGAGTDELDITVLRCGDEVCLRSKGGRYVCASNGNSSDDQDTQSGDVYSLAADGHGTGDPLDCLTIQPVSGGSSSSGSSSSSTAGVPLKFGMTVAIRAPAAKERHLGVRDGKLGFWRALVGTAEQWIVVKAADSSSRPGQRRAGSTVLEEAGSRGNYIRQGDSLLVLSANFEQVLSLHESVEGSGMKMLLKERHSGLGHEFFQIAVFGAVPQPAWADRPYLSQSFLSFISSSSRGSGACASSPFDSGLTSQIHQEVIDRQFPTDTSSSGGSRSSSSSDTDSNITTNLLELDPLTQQSFLVREMLLALSGVTGQFIKVQDASDSNSLSSSSSSSSSAKEQPKSSSLLRNIRFTIGDDVCTDRAVVSQISQLLPICEHAVVVREFIRQQSRQSYGSVSHALSASMRTILREYDVLIAQLEFQFKSSKLSLQRLVFLVQPSAKVLRLLSAISQRLWNSSGGSLLNVLHDLLLEQGDAKNKELAMHLFQEAARPFLLMLSNWIFRGELDDPYKEFMIQEDKSVTRDVARGPFDDFTGSYWENRLSLIPENTPKFLKTIAPRVLTAGKYLNVVRGCIERGNTGDVAAVEKDGVGLLSQLPKEVDIHLDVEGSATALIATVERAYVYSSRSLLHLLESGHKLRSHLQSLSRFFLLDHGDFFIQFMDIAGEDLRRDVKNVNIARIQNLLQTALTTSTLASDTNKDLLTCSLAKTNLIQHLYLIQSAGSSNDFASPGKDTSGSANQPTSQGGGLKGVEALTLEYEVTFPVSLVLSKRAMAKYKLLSRLLYFSKHVELRLLSCWVDHQSTKELNVANGGQGAYLLRQRMIHFIHNFVYYMGLEVIAPRSHEMHEGMKVAVDTDEVLGLHERFLDTCLKECLLSSQDQLRNLTKIMTTCLLFADHMTQFNDNSFVTLKSSIGKLTNGTQLGNSNGGGNAANVSRVGRRSKATTVRIGTEVITIAEPRDTGAQRRARLATQSKYLSSEMNHQSFKRILAKFYDTFESQVGGFLESLWVDSYRTHPQLANLCTRLDYNGFYSSRLAGTGANTAGPPTDSANN